LFVPALDEVGVKIAWLVPVPFVIANSLPAVVPFTDHPIAIGSEFPSVAFATRVVLPPTPITVPVAAGLWLAQTGGVFRTTVHVFESELEPFVTSISRRLFPGVRSAEIIGYELEVAPLIGVPFNFQV
jgi:hypothetical protein